MALLLVVLSWSHWLLVTIATAVVVHRAMRPTQEICFVHHCVVNKEALIIRCKIIRPTVALIAPEVKLACYRAGMRINLPLSGGIVGWPMWEVAAPLTIRHLITEDSPLHPILNNGGLNGVLFITVSVQATDASGLRL
ncbi:unnamed protein product [Amoebophrya sp. A25]|nr:unnamed protein product [Amoebophrya sp. A25]|eukprot:GSA25T00011298001.1